MARKVFFSFHYDHDNWRASQIRNIGAIEGNQPCSDNDWESVKKGGDAAIEKWISNQLSGRTCTVILVGSATAGRKWITHEIVESWNKGIGVVGIRIHGLKNSKGLIGLPGPNPFSHVTLKKDGTLLSSVVKLYDPTSLYGGSVAAYNAIKNSLPGWVEEAIAIRALYD